MTKPVITENERTIIRNRLYNEYGFNQKKLALVDELMDEHIKDAERYGDPVGVSPAEVKEIDEKIEKKDPHHLYSVQLSEPEKVAVKKLLDDYLKLNK